MSRIYNHLVDRETVFWTSLGKYGKGPVRQTIIKDLCDSHLLNIIDFIQRNPRTYGSDHNLQYFLETEVIYRVDNGISIPEYYGLDDPQEGENLY